MQIEPGRAAAHRWTLVGHLDATRADLEASTTREAIQFQNNPSDEVAVVMQLRRRGHNPAVQKALAALEMAVLPAGLLAAGLALTALPAWAAVSIGWKAASLGVAALHDGRKRWNRMQEQPKYHQEPAWTGTRTYDLSAARPVGEARLTASPTQSTASVAAPEAKELGGLLADSFQRYPSEYTAVLISGHANGYRKLAGMDPHQVVGALAESHQQTGKKVDLVVLEACKMGNLEALKEMGQHAKFALVSQDEMWAAGLPWGYVLPRLEELGKDPKTLGESLVKMAGGLEHKVPTLALIDLEKVGALSQTMEDLADRLHAGLGTEQEAGILQAFGDSHRFPGAFQSERGGIMGRLENLWHRLKDKAMPPDLGDVGGFLDGLQAHCSDEGILKAADQARQLLSEAVVSNQVTQHQSGHASGLTMRMPTGVFFKKRYQQETGMQKWGALLHDLQPWRTRVSNTLGEPIYQALPFLPPELGS